MEKEVRKLTRTGRRSLSLVIPAGIIAELNLKEKQRMTVRRSGTKIIIEDWKK